MARITIRVDDDRKQEWQSEVDNNPKYESLTHLIQLGVITELQEDRSAGTVDRGGGYDPEVSNVELKEALTELHRDLKQVSEDVGDIEREVTPDAEPHEKLYFSRLPESEADAVTPEQIADSMEYGDAEEARELFEKLRMQTGRVRTIEIKGDTHYYKDV